MKKLSLLFAFLIGLSLNAQNFKIGLTLAPTINFNKNYIKNVDGDWKTTEGTGGLGWKGGLLADYNFAGNYNIHSGLLIHSKNLSTDNMTQTLTTLEIPLALKLRTKEVTDNVHITGFFGGTLDLNVAAKYKDSEGGEIQNLKDFNPLGVSFMAGAGGEYDLDFGSIGVGLSYHLGFTDIAKNKDIKTFSKHLSIDFVFYF